MERKTEKKEDEVKKDLKCWRVKNEKVEVEEVRWRWNRSEQRPGGLNERRGASEEVSVKRNTRTMQVKDVSSSLSKQTSHNIFPSVLYNFGLLRVSFLSVDSKLLPPLREKSKNNRWGSTREEDKSLKDGQLLWGTVSKSSWGRQRWLEMCCVGGRVTARTDETD